LARNTRTRIDGRCRRGDHRHPEGSFRADRRRNGCHAVSVGLQPIIAEAHDASHGIYDAVTGETLIQGKSGLPIFVGVMAFAVKAVIDKAAERDGLNPGDVWIFNDPYDGGTHLSDFRLVKPVFHDGELFCFLASVGHWHDVGGNVPGNYNPAATEAFQEGMLIPPVKLYDRGEFRQDIVDILSANSRLPMSLYGDLNGQINALDLGGKRVGQLLEEYGVDTASTVLSTLKERAATMMRAQIRNLPSGTVSAEDWLDNDGITDEPLKIALDLTIDGDRMGYEGIVRDVTPFKKMEAELRRLATTDSLTGINNRRHFMELAHKEMSRSRRHGYAFSLIMLDIDHFKKINDTHGHASGDQVLRECCGVCLSQLRESDIMGRLGGEEFAIALPECGGSAAEAVANRIRSAMASHTVTTESGAIQFTASMGVTEFQPDDNLEAALERADNALYLAKKNGRDQVMAHTMEDAAA
jgi:diguanylate cyclase (GGDEF)-like protein